VDASRHAVPAPRQHRIKQRGYSRSPSRIALWRTAARVPQNFDGVENILRVLADPPRHFDEDAMNFRQFVVEEPD